MADGNRNDFFLEQQRAVERMRATANRSLYNQPMPKQKETPQKPQPQNPPTNKKPDSLDNILSQLNIPLLSRIKNDSDTVLIIGLFLLLTAENSDRLLLLALFYILL